MKLEFDTYLALLTIVIGSIIVLSQVLFRNGLVFYGDFSFPITLEKYSLAFQAPNPRPNMAFTYMYPFFALSFALDFSIEALVKQMLVVGLLLTGFSAYFAGREILKDLGYFKKSMISLASLMGSYFYMFNPWSMDRVGHYFLWIGYALSPIILMLGIKLTKYDRVNYRLVFITSFVWSIASITPFGALSNTILLFSWIFYSAVLATLSKQYRMIVISLKALAFTSFIYLFFNAHWILSYIASSLRGVLRPPYIVSWENVQMLSQNSNFLNVIELVGNWWPKVQYWLKPSLYLPWMLASVLIPIIVISASLASVRNKYTIFLLLVYIFSVPLSMGSNGPFSEIYKWLVFGAPFSERLGWVFRDPNKWNGLTALAYSFLIGISFSAILSHNFKQINIGFFSKFRLSSRHMSSALVFFSILTLLVVYVGPTVYSYFTHIYKPVEIPQEYYHVNTWLKTMEENTRVLWLAPLSYGTTLNGMIRYSWAPDKPYTSLIDSWSSAKPSIAPATDEAKRYTAFLYKSIRDGYVDKYLASLGVKYIVYHNDILGAETQGLLDIEDLMTQKGLKLVWREGFIYVFEMHSYTPRIFIPPKTLLVIGGLDSLTMLDLVLPFNSTNISYLFLEQKFYDTSILNITKEVVIINKDVVDLALSFLNKKYVVAPFEYTIHADPLKDWAKTSVYEDWWNWPFPKNLTGFWDWDYGMGLVKTATPNVKLNVPYVVDHADTYSVWVRCLESPLGGEISISLDKNNIRTIDTLGDRGLKWFKAESISLSAGEHNLILENRDGFNAVNVIALVPLSVENQLLDLVQGLNITNIVENRLTQREQLPVTTKEVIVNNNDSKALYANTVAAVSDSEIFAQIVNYTQISPTEWVVHINTTRPFILEFTEVYDPFWTVDSEGFSIQSFPTNSVNNGFLVNKTGSFTLIIKYKPQSYFYMGLWMATFSFISMFLLLVSPKLIAFFSGFRARKARVLSKTHSKN